MIHTAVLETDIKRAQFDLDLADLFHQGSFPVDEALNRQVTLVTHTTQKKYIFPLANISVELGAFYNYTD